MITNNKTPGNFKHAWLAKTLLIIGDSVLTGTRNNYQITTK